MTAGEAPRSPIDPGQDPEPTPDEKGDLRAPESPGEDCGTARRDGPWDRNPARWVPCLDCRWRFGTQTTVCYRCASWGWLPVKPPVGTLVVRRDPDDCRVRPMLVMSSRRMSGVGVGVMVSGYVFHPPRERRAVCPTHMVEHPESPVVGVGPDVRWAEDVVGPMDSEGCWNWPEDVDE